MACGGIWRSVCILQVSIIQHQQSWKTPLIESYKGHYSLARCNLILVNCFWWAIAHCVNTSITVHLSVQINDNFALNIFIFEFLKQFLNNVIAMQF